MKYDVVIIGGGPAGSTAGLYLAKSNIKTAIIEQKEFPREVLCGEFLSYNVFNFIKRLNLENKFFMLKPNRIDTLNLYSNKEHVNYQLPFTAFSLKRSMLDKLLLEEAKTNGVEVFQPYKVINVTEKDDRYFISISNSSETIEIETEFLICAYGKQNYLDKILKRANYGIKSSYTGIKYHLASSLLHNIDSASINIYMAKNIYCGINSVSDDEKTLCYLVSGNNFSSDLKQPVTLYQKNNFFAQVFNENFSDTFSNSKTYGTANIFFGKREVARNKILWIGDAAAVISPFTGDGISLALESAELAATSLISYYKYNLDYKLYAIKWNNLFRSRIKLARKIQKVILSNYGDLSISLLKKNPFLLNYIVNKTR